jgi:crotonobetaine/carnitine-CoA ligase
MHTGDLAKIDGMGNVFFLVKEKDLIRRRGENVNACEVEEELLRHPHVDLATAIEVRSSLGDGTEEEIKVCVVKRQGSALTEH